MKKMKMVSIILAGIMAISLTACAGSTEMQDTPSNAEFEALSNRVQELEDKAAILELVDAFSNLADEKDAESQALLFTEDAEVTINFGGQQNVITGREEIAQVFGGVVGGMDALYHMNGQVSIDLDGDTATGTVYCRVALLNTVDGVTTLSDEAVTYQDTYVKQDGEWLISSRISNFVFVDGHEMASSSNE